jgi:tyrosinase
MSIRVRRSITELQDEYKQGNKKQLEDLMRAWKGIKELPAEDPHSFFMLGGYHGEPFRGGGWSSSAYWGGYCNHGNVLFPTWHRMYLLKLEESLRSIPGCTDVVLPYWDETSDESCKNGLPWALTDETFELDGVIIPNPLRSFVFNKNITDNINGDNPNYSKPHGYETVRYPLSGLVGTSADRAATDQHNAQYPSYVDNVEFLNQNVVGWLSSYVIINGKPVKTGVYQKFVDCLHAPNYTVFSNTSSAAQWNEDAGTTIVPIESPHNSIHLAIGGFDVPTQGDYSPIQGANGDMGENDTAGLDPIFYFHHCFIDRIFWLWQKKHHSTDSLEIIPAYPGTNTVDNQGATPGLASNSWLTLETPLNPFTKSDGTVYTSLDCINIEKQLGYTYGPGSLEELAAPTVAAERVASTKAVRVSGLNRGSIRGSFLIAAYAEINGEKVLLGTESILSRWSVQGCVNCQTHLETRAAISLHGLEQASFAPSGYQVEVHTRDGLLGGAALAERTPGKRAFRVEVR